MYEPGMYEHALVEGDSRRESYRVSLQLRHVELAAYLTNAYPYPYLLVIIMPDMGQRYGLTAVRRTARTLPAAIDMCMCHLSKWGAHVVQGLDQVTRLTGVNRYDVTADHGLETPIFIPAKTPEAAAKDALAQWMDMYDLDREVLEDVPLRVERVCSARAIPSGEVEHWTCQGVTWVSGQEQKEEEGASESD